MKRCAVVSMIVMLLSMGCAGGRDKAASVLPGYERQPSLASVHFATSQTSVSDRETVTIEHNADLLHELPSVVLVLEGHADERGSREFNLELGDRRARAVMEEMQKHGVPLERMIVVSKGENEPLASGHHEAAWRKNRRVEFVVR